MSPKYVIGVDGGTGGIRAGLFEIATGAPVGFADSPYETTYPKPGYAEQQPEDWWAGMGASVRRVLAETGVSPDDVAGLCCDTTCCTVVALDDAGDPLMPCILWMDMRAAEQTKQVRSEHRRARHRRKPRRRPPRHPQVLATKDDALRVNSDGAGPVSAEWMVPKALWLKQNRPEIFASAAKICEYQDYVNLKLTGRYCASANNVAVRWHFVEGAPRRPCSRSSACRSSRRSGRRTSCRWATRWRRCRRRPRRTWASTPAFRWRRAAPTLSSPWSASGPSRPGQLALITGSSTSGWWREFHGRGIWGTYSGAGRGTQPRGRGRTDVDGLGGELVQDAVRGGEGFLRRGQRRRGADSARVRGSGGAGTPAGESHPARGPAVARRGLRSPRCDTGARTCTAPSSKESPSARVSSSTPCARTDTSRVRRRRGGATRSDLWLQIHADVAGIPFKRTKCADAPALGAAILAAVAAEAYPNVATAVDAMVHDEGVVMPRPDVHALYEAPYAAYKGRTPRRKTLIRRQGKSEEGVDPRRGDGGDTSPGPTATVCPSLLSADQGNLAGDVSRMIADGSGLAPRGHHGRPLRPELDNRAAGGGAPQVAGARRVPGLPPVLRRPRRADRRPRRRAPRR